MPKFSQVFLADKGVCSRIASSLDAFSFDTLVEIGPGGGALTEFLFPQYGPRMRAVEIDQKLVPALKTGFPGLEIINRDFLATDPGEVAGPGRAAFIGNLPYECSTAILERVLSFDRLEAAVFMFQKEVARRITAPPGGGDYGVLTLMCAARASSELLLDVKAGSFSPVPAVDSSVLLFRPRPFFSQKTDEAAFRTVVKKAFSHRRKTLVNSLGLCGVDKAAVSAALEELGLKPAARAQELSLQNFAVLSAALGKK